MIQSIAHVALVVRDYPGGRVTFFLRTDDFWRDYDTLRSRGIEFARPPMAAPYEMVAVFKDLYGDLWDLVRPDTTQQRGPTT